MKKASEWVSGRYKSLAKSLPDREIFVFAFFVVLSFIFWYLNSLSKDVDASINYPVRYINPPRDRMLVESPPEKLALQVSGPGYSILKVKLSGSRAPLVVDLSKSGYRKAPGSNQMSYYLLSNSLSSLVEKQLRAEFKVTSIGPDTLFFSFDRILTKKVPVKPELDITPARQFMVFGDIKADPDSVEISGPRPIVDTIKYVSTKRQRYNNLNQTIKRSVLLVSPKGYTMDVRRVQVEIPIEQFTEASFDLKIKMVNVPDSVNLVLFPDKVSVKCLVSKTDYKRLNASSFEAFVDLKGVDLMNSEKLVVKMGSWPDYITSLNFGPEKIDFIFEKRDDF